MSLSSFNATSTISYYKSSDQCNRNTSKHQNVNPGTPFDLSMDFLLSLILAISVYLVAVLIYFEWNLRKNPNKVTKGQCLNKSHIAPWLRFVSILAAFFCIMRCTNDILYYKYPMDSDISCTAIKNLGVTWLVSADTAVYLFLWLRQRVLYRKRAMQNLSNMLISITSWLSLFLILMIFLLMNGQLFWRLYVYCPIAKRCVSVPNVVLEVIPLLWTISSTLLHIFLVSLYVFPLIKQSCKFHLNTSGSMFALISVRDGRPVRGRQQNKTNDSIPATRGTRSLMVLVIRCVIISLICVITDGITVGVTMLLVTRPGLTKLRHFIYNANIVLNCVCIVASFRRWKEMLFPFRSFFCGKKNDRSSVDEIENCRNEQTTSSSVTTKFHV